VAGSLSAGPGWTRRFAALAAAGALSAAIAVVPAQAATAGPAHAGAVHGLPREKASSGVGVFRPRAPRVARVPASYRPTRTAWPQAATATLRLPDMQAPRTVPAPVTAVLFAEPGGGLVSSSRSPILAGRVPGSPVAAVRASVLSHASATAAGVRGVVFTVSAASGSASGRSSVGLSYAAFSQVYGGNYGTTLGLTELPACALTTPQKRACDRMMPLQSVNNPVAQTVSAVVNLPARPHGAPDISAGPAVVLLRATSDRRGAWPGWSAEARAVTG